MWRQFFQTKKMYFATKTTNSEQYWNIATLSYSKQIFVLAMRKSLQWSERHLVSTVQGDIQYWGPIGDKYLGDGGWRKFVGQLPTPSADPVYPTQPLGWDSQYRESEWKEERWICSEFSISVCLLQNRKSWPCVIFTNPSHLRGMKNRTSPLISNIQ